MNPTQQETLRKTLGYLSDFLAPPAFEDAHEWLAHVLENDRFRHRSGHRAGTAVQPHGTILDIHKTLIFPNRYSVIPSPYDDHLRDRVGFHVKGKFDGPAIRNERAPNNKRANGNFDCNFRGFLKWGGLLWNGAQNSRIEAIVHDAPETGVALGYGGCRYELNLEVRNGSSSKKGKDPKQARGTGCYGKSIKGVSGLGNFHHTVLGWHFIDALTINIASSVHENVATPVKIEGPGRGRSEFNAQHCMRPSEVVVDLQGYKGTGRIWGTIDDVPFTEALYIDKQGNRELLCKMTEKATNGRTKKLKTAPFHLNF